MDSTCATCHGDTHTCQSSNHHGTIIPCCFNVLLKKSDGISPMHDILHLAYGCMPVRLPAPTKIQLADSF